MAVHTVTLTRDVRVFRQHLDGGNKLSRQGSHFKAGTKLDVRPPVTMLYDHRDLKAHEVLGYSQPYWILVEELGVEFSMC